MVRVDLKKGLPRECQDATQWRLHGHALELLRPDGKLAKDGPFDSADVISVNGESIESIRAASQAEKARDYSCYVPQDDAKSVFSW